MNKQQHFIFIFICIATYFAVLCAADMPAQQPPFDSIEKQQDAIQSDQKTSIQPVDPLALPILPAADATEKASPTEKSDIPKKDIYLNFENTSLANFVNYMAELKKLNVIPDKGIEEAKISLIIRDPLSIDGAWSIFLTVLETAGFSMVQSGEVWKVLPKDKKLTEALPSYINVPPDTLPNSDIEIRYVMFLENVKVTDVRDLLSSMLSNPNTLVDHQDANAFIITDKSYNIKAAAKLLLELDQIGLQETVTVVRLQKANAKDVSELLGALIKKPDANPLARLLGKAAEGATEYFSSTTRIIPEERTNSLILLGNNASIDKLINFITQYIDTELVATASPLHIYECKHTDAEAVKGILEEVTQAPESSVGQAAGKYGAIRGGVKYFKSMRFQVDKDGNRLIVSCTDKNDWKMLKKTLIDLDKPQPQVAIETLIVSVNSNDIKALGGMVRNKKHGQIGHNIDFQSSPLASPPNDFPSLETKDNTPISLLGDLLGQLVNARGSTLLSFGKINNIWSVFRILREQTNATILSQPFLTVTNKTAATIKVGEERQVLSEQGDTNSFERIPVNTSIEVTPQINLEGLIRLDMTVSIQDFGDDAGRIRFDKTIKTGITVANGQVLVLGGFVKTKAAESKTKTPILSDIPVLGWFFKKQDRTITKDYIFIFMVPTIIKPRQTPGTQLYTKMKMHAATASVEDAVQTQVTNDPIHNWFFNPEKENYSHKVIDFANARYQPTTVDIRNDPYYRTQTRRQELEEEKKEGAEDKLRRHSLELDAAPITQKAKSTLAPKEIPPAKPVALQVTPPTPPPVSITQPATSREAEIKELPLESVRPPKIIQDAANTPEQQLLASPQTPGMMQPAQPTVLYDRTSEQTQTLSEQELQAKRQKLKALLNGAPLDGEYYPAESENVDTTTQKRSKLKQLIAQDTPQDFKRAQFKQSVAALPQEEIKRTELKQLLVPPTQNEEQTLEQKRQQLKAIFANKDYTPPNNVQKSLIDHSKRNRLKEFLAQQADQEKNISRASHPRRKVAA